MAVNRLFRKTRHRRSQKVAPVSPSECIAESGHEAVEVSLCDEGMCFCSQIQHDIGVVLLVDFEPEARDNSLSTEAVVVDCQLSPCGRSYDITVLFTGN